MTRRILVCTIGASPAIVTETVWALRERDWRPDEIHIVTTTHRLEHIREHLQRPGSANVLHALCAARVLIHVPCLNAPCDIFEPERQTPPHPAALADIDSEEDAAAMGSAILAVVTEATRSANTQVHLSLAGGRKTMSAHALLAFALRARVDDEASHVLVSPQAFESNEYFWHPDQGGKIPLRRGEPPSLDPKHAEIKLVPTPIPMLRYFRGVEEISTQSLEETIRRLNLAAELKTRPRVVVRPARGAIEVCGEEVRLPAAQFLLFYLLSLARREQWFIEPDVQDDPELAGWLSYESIAERCAPNGERLRELYASWLAQAVENATGLPPDIGDVAVDGDAATTFESWRRRVLLGEASRRTPEVRDILSIHKSRLNAALRRKLGAVAVTYLGPQTRKPLIGLGLPPEAIVIDH